METGVVVARLGPSTSYLARSDVIVSFRCIPCNPWQCTYIPSSSLDCAIYHFSYTTTTYTYSTVYQHGRHLHLPEQLRVRRYLCQDLGIGGLMSGNDRACGPSGTGCACPKGKCDCQNCTNHASAQSTVCYSSV